MKTIGVLMGGYSDEYVISLKSGAFIFDHFDKEKYHVYKVHILQDGWDVIEDNTKYTIDKEDFSFTKDGTKIQFDAVYNTIHGTPGEDGHLQAYFELINLPYSGARFYTSALTFNKRDTLSVLAKFGIKKADSLYLKKGEEIHFSQVENSLGLPFFVKPNQSGSSLGVSRVTREEEFEPALQKAFKEDPEILIESELKGREISVGVIKKNNQAKAVGITEIIPENDFFDYEAKYHGESQEVTPADLSAAIQKKVFETTEKIYTSLNLTGIARIDFILQNDEPYFIEANTNPGMSPASIFPQQVEAANLSMSELLDNEIQIALEEKPIWKKG